MSLVKDNPVTRGLQFVRESRNELRKVSWPGRKETTAVTTIVIIAVFLIGFFLAIVDWLFSGVVKGLIGG